MAEIERSFYLDKNSLALLLNSKGVNSLQCFDLFGNEVNVDDSQACMTLYNLVQEGLAGVSGEEFVPDTDLDNIIGNMVFAQKILVVYSGNRNISNIAFYINKDTAVIMEQDTEREHFLKLSSLSVGDIFSVISNRFLKNMKNDILVEDIADCSDMYLNSLSLLTVGDDFEKVISSEDTYLFFDFIDAVQNRSYSEIALIRSKSGLVTFEWKNDAVRSQYYTYKGLTDIFYRCLEGRK